MYVDKLIHTNKGKTYTQYLLRESKCEGKTADGGLDDGDIVILIEVKTALETADVRRACLRLIGRIVFYSTAYKPSIPQSSSSCKFQ